MKIFPAIDIIDGKVVRLFKGDYNAVTNYKLSPVEAALAFKEKGASHIHAVDLDGAKSGTAVNAETVKRIISATDAFVEIGGGIRSMEQIESYLSAGAKRVILGTAAIKNFEFTKSAVKAFGDRIAVGVDADNGLVAVSGWRELTAENSVDFCMRLVDIGVSTIIYTDISCDGTLGGTNIAVYKRLAGIGADIVASGGISSLEEIKTLKDMGVSGAILGKALYENIIDLSDAVRVGEGDGDAC